MKDSRSLAKEIAIAASEKKGRNIVLLNLQEVSLIADYFVIVSAGSSTQVKAIADSILKKLREEDIVPRSREGYQEAQWILLDYGGVVTHIFQEEQRQFYDLERLWGDAESEQFQGS
ncbi:ribosome silencing factor [Metallumcola ferriviriculae]|uniref:Ribosomal silencing factor RsfS n=1 Tax=Metallumcola ferriviriculae TaxID=3039180 RepID=A0AAU0UL48_9FIRM|nr:ribosome silencing factor [Desulfitibacteraceae bacterium MK1]